MSIFECNMIRFILILFSIVNLQALNAQLDSTDHLKISLLTCDAGQDLYSIFGHSAIRVNNLATGKDLVFNYGTFDFDEPGFMYKFLKGKLNYKLAIQPYEGFIRSYQRQRRSVDEQVVNLTAEQKINVEVFLHDNYRPENRNYLYDFFHDNCATRIRDVFEDESGGQFLVPESEVLGLSFRQGLDQFNKNWPWTDFGMDLILGLNADKKMEMSQEMYLPDYLSDNMAKYIVNRNGEYDKLLGPLKSVLKFPNPVKKPIPWPLIVFTGLFLLTLILQKFVQSDILHRVVDLFIFGVLGIVGLQMIFMWFGTDHVSCQKNLNVLWANPLYLLLLFPIYKKMKIKWAFMIILIVSVALMAGWKFNPQEFHSAVLPILGIIVLRCIYRLRDQIKTIA